jgi:HK97 family phage major capsid protein
MNIAQQIGEANRGLSLDSAATDYTRYAKTQAVRAWWYRRHGLMLDELQIATAVRGVSSRLQKMFEMRPETIGDITKKIMDNDPVELPGMQQKTAVGVGSIDGGTWGSALAPFQQASAAFLQSLSPFSAFDRLLNDNAFTRLPLRTRVAIASDAAVGSTVEELQPKPVSQMSFSTVQMPAYKAIGQVVLTDETVLSVSPAAEKLFESQMQQKVAMASDAKFLEIVTEGTGVVSNPSSGLTAAQFLADLGTALEAIEVAGAGSKLYLVLPASAFKTVSNLRDAGGYLVVNNKIGAITPIATSAGVDAVLLDATAVGADTDIVTTKISDQSDIIMQDNPTVGSHQHISLFQNNLTLIRCERFFGVTILRPNGVAVIANMTTA